MPGWCSSLTIIKPVESQPQRGKLKIFLGYADGVGKTYAMLEAARRRKAEGVDVVAAWLKVDKGTETEALAAGLESIPPRRVEADQPVEEMDLEAVLNRKPQLALVDDLAHRNAPGSRHARRYQDVLEFLEAGVNVYTTMNVQHLESLTDVVRQITGQEVEETVPDGVVDEADELEMVDLPPEELLERLQRGGLGEAADHVSARIGELAALRQMALRETAERVDNDMRDFMATRSIHGPWAAAERVMVCISAHPIGDRLIRSGRRLAEALRAEWFVVFVETPRHLQMPPGERAMLLRYLRIAEEMGAQPITLTGESVVEALVEFARQQNITRIIIGKPRRSRWLELVRGSRVDRLLERCGSTDVFVISDELPPPQPGWWRGVRFRAPVRHYFYSLGIAILVTLVSLWLQRWFEPTHLVMLFLGGIVISGAYLGRGPGVVSALVSGAAFVSLLDHPAPLLTPRDLRHLVTLGGMMAAGLFAGTLTGWLRAQVRAARQREIQTSALSALSRDLTTAIHLDEMLKAVLHHVSQIFHCQAAVLLPEVGQLKVRLATPAISLNALDLEAASWAFSHGQPAGAGTETMNEARVRCLPLETRNGVVGVLAIHPLAVEQFQSPDQRDLLAGFGHLAALAIERARLNEQAQQAAILQTTEKLQAALLNSISHDLRTPLSTVSGAISSLLEAEQSGEELDDSIRLDLLENADEEADRLNRLVGNLLDMTRLEAGAMRVHKRPCDVRDLIGAALSQAPRRLAGREVHTHIPDNLPDVALDFVLMVQVLYNLLDNAAKYSPESSEIDITAGIHEDELWISVADRGVGIPPDDLQRIFDKFYRVQRPDGVPGTGLGLSICRGIVEVHGGRIWAENRVGGGAVITLAIPVGEPPKNPTGQEG